MIVWFSGTGNSRYVAKRLSVALNQNMVEITEADKESFISADESCGLVFPVYSWGLPAPVFDFLKKSVKNRPYIQKYFWAVMTCGDETGDAPEILKSLAENCHIHFSAIFSVQMPNNYVLLPGFDVDSESVRDEKLISAPARIAEICTKIAAKEHVEDYVRGSWPRLKTRLVYPLFRRMGINPSKFSSDEHCIHCGKCADVCPVRNVTIDSNDSRPRWGSNCVSCLACYHICPRHSVAYGKATKYKGQYFFSESMINDWTEKE